MISLSDPAFRDAGLRCEPGESDGRHAGTMARYLRMAQPNYVCAECGDPDYKGEVRFISHDISLTGTLNVICRECWNEGPRGYRSKTLWRFECAMEWLRRAYRNDLNGEEFMQGLPWEESTNPPPRPHQPYEFDLLRRHGLIRKSTRLAVGMTAGTFKLRADHQVELVKVIDHWVDQLGQQSQGPRLRYGHGL